MSENKEYVFFNEDNGSCFISKDVVAVISAASIVDVEGVAGLSTSLGDNISDLFGKKNPSKGIKVNIEGQSVTIDVFMMVSYGFSILDVTHKVQAAIKNAVESVAGVSCASVNVNVCGVAFDK